MRHEGVKEVSVGTLVPWRGIHDLHKICRFKARHSLLSENKVIYSQRLRVLKNLNHFPFLLIQKTALPKVIYREILYTFT